MQAKLIEHFAAFFDAEFAAHRDFFICYAPALVGGQLQDLLLAFFVPMVTAGADHMSTQGHRADEEDYLCKGAPRFILLPVKENGGDDNDTKGAEKSNTIA